MTPSLVVLFVAAAAAVAFISSGLAALGVASVRLERLTASAQARLLFAVALFPAFATAVALAAALAPSFGWIADHCGPSGDPHLHHPHICAAHHSPSVPALTVLALAALFVGRLGHAVAKLGRASVSAVLTRRKLERLSGGRGLGSVHVLPLEEPQALSVGLLRIAVFVTRGLVTGDDSQHLEPVIAHEHAHVRRRHALARLLAGFGLAFHLPGVAAFVERRLARAHEMEADADAAAEHGAERVARALIRIARVRCLAAQAALGFSGSEVEARVEALLDSRPRRDQPRAGTLLGLAALLACAFAFGADGVHHGLEILLGVIGG